MEALRLVDVSARGAEEVDPTHKAANPSVFVARSPLVIAVLSYGVSAWHDDAVLSVVHVIGAEVCGRWALRQRIGHEVSADEALYLHEDVLVLARGHVVVSDVGPVTVPDDSRSSPPWSKRTALRSVVAYLAFPVVVAIGFYRQFSLVAYL